MATQTMRNSSAVEIVDVFRGVLERDRYWLSWTPSVTGQRPRSVRVVSGSMRFNVLATLRLLEEGTDLGRGLCVKRCFPQICKMLRYGEVVSNLGARQLEWVVAKTMNGLCRDGLVAYRKDGEEVIYDITVEGHDFVPRDITVLERRACAALPTE